MNSSMPLENRGIHAGEDARASETDPMIELEHLKRKQSFSASEEEDSASQILEDIIIPTLTDDLYDYLKIAISEHSLEVSGDLWKSEDEIPSGQASHTSLQVNGENPEGELFLEVPMDEKEPQTCFCEEGEEAATRSQTNLNGYLDASEFKEDKLKSSSSEQEIEPDVDCDHFQPVNVVADKFVAWITETAVAAVSLSCEQEDGSAQNRHTVTFMESYSFSCPTIREFTPQVGSQAIQEFIATWYYLENWKYDVQLVLQQSDESSDYFTYETKWGIPTKQNPIPQATASIFFVFEVSRVKPVNCIVDMTYYFERCSYIQAPSVNSFDEKQLFDIVYAKLKFYKQLKF